MDFAFVPSALLPDLCEWLSEDSTSMWLPRWMILPPDLKPKGCGLMTGDWGGKSVSIMLTDDSDGACT